MRNLFSWPAFQIVFFIFPLASLAQGAETYFEPLKYRSIGPFRGGRSVAASGVIGDPLTYYMGTTGGGLWKTRDAGQRWTNISDGYFQTGSVGAIAVSTSNPNILYCGMGEHAVRGVMSSYGDGIYKSTDAGKTWKHMGLDKTQHIARILIHPTDPDLVYVAAQGALYGPTEERGIYRSRDGGSSWERVLYVNDLSGGTELSMDLNTPEVLYAALWHHQRTPHQIISGGSGSGLYKSTDGGDSWKQIHNGLPEAKGKMAIAVSAANANKLYALVESDSNRELGGLFVSADAGQSWKKVSSDHRLVQRAWYYIELYPDPKDEHTVYVLSAPALRSIDGGKTWEDVPGPHGDYHDLWINPDKPDNMVLADDGGASISFDGGETWSPQNNMPTAQFYRISTDNVFPFRIYSGQQDNTSVRIASLSLGRDGITEADWTYTAGGESAFLAFDPDHPRYVLGGSYLGYIDVLDMESKHATMIMASPINYLSRAARDMKYLYNWNAPIIGSLHEPGTYYHAAQLVLRTRDMGQNWEEVSPDLSRNLDEKQGYGGAPYTNEAVGAENYGTIAYMVESPHEKGVFWTGSDDGLVHISRDGCKSWENVTPNGLGETLVNAIEISPHDKATAYIATTRYKFNDHTPALYKTTDYGKNWTNISSGIPYGSFTRVVREAVGRKDLLFAGTEKGMYLSWNGGKQWEPFQLNLPRAPVTDLKIHQGDLIVATSGRSFWILDELAALEQFNQGGERLLLYSPEPALNAYWGSPLSEPGANVAATHPFQGVNPANGMVLYYELPPGMDSIPLSLEIRDSGNQLVRKFSSVKDSSYQKYDGGPPPAPLLSQKAGLNRFVWDLNYPLLPGIPNVYLEAFFEGHRAPPGTYSLRLFAGAESVTASASILPTPGIEVAATDYQSYHNVMREMEATLTEMHQLVNGLHKARLQLEALLGTMPAGPLKDEGKTLLVQMKAWDEEMVQRKSKAYDDVENFPNRFTAEYFFLLNHMNSSIPRINTPSLNRRKELEAQWGGFKTRAETLKNKDIPAYNSRLWEAGIGAIQL